MKTWIKWWLIGGIIGAVIIDLFSFLIPCLWVLLRFGIKDQCTNFFSWTWENVLINFLIGGFIAVIALWIRGKVRKK